MSPASISLLFFGILLRTAMMADWTYYGAKGPDHWYKTYPICAQKSQSPINIYTGDVTPNVISQPFAFQNYEVTEGMQLSLSNNGHTAKVSIAGSSIPRISGGGLGADFVADQFHFHWSTDRERGSEHHISSQGYPCELHIVHHRASYGSLSQAADKPDGLAVLGFVFEISPAGNPNYNNLVDALSRVTDKDSPSVVLPPQTLNSFLPQTFSNFYRYSGSLTTPACYESVTWTVFKEPIKISKAQLAAFLNLKKDESSYILDNVRPVQPINGREIISNFDSAVKWGYYDGVVDADAYNWNKYYEECDAKSQSPVNIGTQFVQLDEGLGAFSFKNFDQTNGISMKLSNNGYTIKVSVSGATTISVSNGGLEGQFNVAQFHFHWGANSYKGSEHFVDDKKYPLEVHIVTYNASLGSLGNAAKIPNGLAVLGFFYEVSDSNNAAMEPILSQLNQIVQPDAEVSITPFTLDSFLPADRSMYFRYPGSLTTPGCYESVIWSVFKSTIKISESQLNQMRQLKSSVKDVSQTYVALLDNYRPIQKLHSRIVRANFDVKTNYPIVWNYFGLNDPYNWKVDFPTCGSQVRQSPINIKNRDVLFQDMAPFSLTGFDSTAGVEVKLKNNGHTAEVEYEGGLLQVQGGGLTGTFKVAQFHFHWGSNELVGSEHAIDGNYFPMELHIVTYNQKYPNIQAAVTQSDGLAVLGFMFKISKKDNSALTQILDHFDKIKEPKTQTSIPSFKLDSFMRLDLTKFYRYPGSLTTPGCLESVTWTVFDGAIDISEKQLNIFRSLKSSDVDRNGDKMNLVNNFRPIQPIGNRNVISNFYLSSAPKSAATTSIFTSVALFVGGWWR